MKNGLSDMINKLTFLLFVASTICLGQSIQDQSVWSTPSVGTQPGSVDAAEPATDAGQEPLEVPDRNREMRAPVPRTPGLPAAMPKGSADKEPATARIVGPLKTKSEFERYAEDATGRRLPVYGRQMFDEVPTTFAPLENVPVPADYVLGPGDELLIRAWGKVELNSRLTVDRTGQINLPRVGTLTVADLRFGQLAGFLRAAIGGIFKDFELNVALGQLRSIQVFVLGDARQPGAYTVSSLSTLVDALFASGGPSATGTMRHIELRREGRTVSDLDLYDLMEKGDKSHDVKLLPGDVIFIPHIGPQMAISGDVNLPGIYELKGESTVGAALENAGGITSLADTGRAVLERIDAHANRTVEEFALDAAGQALTVKDGDLLRVFPLSPKFSNAITLRGNVAEPGLYPWKEGMRVSDLIPSRASLITRDYWNRQNHLVRPEGARPFAGGSQSGFGVRPEEGLAIPGDTRKNASGEDLPVTRGNQFSDSGRNRGLDEPGSENDIANDIAAQGSDPGEDSTSRSVASIGQNGAEINWEYALIERLDERDLSTHLIPFRLASAIDEPASQADQLLKPGDVVTIFSRADLELPMEKHASFVRVGGEVNAPGVYRVDPGETLRDVVERAGGLTGHSYLYASIFTRVSARLAQETQMRQSAEQMQKELMSKFANAAPQAGQSGADQQAELAMQQAALARLTSIKPTGRVVLDMQPTATTVADIPAFPLEDGDTLYIPPRLSTVEVAGEVYNANAFRYQPGERLITYLNAAGGATREADPKRMFVIRADGTVVSRQSRNSHSHGSYDNLKLLPGDAIVVPEKLRVSSKMSDLAQATQFVSQSALTAAALSVVR